MHTAIWLRSRSLYTHNLVRPKLSHRMFPIFFPLQFRANSKSKKVCRYHQRGGNIRLRRREPFPLMFSWVSWTKDRVTSYLFFPFNSTKANKLPSIKFYQTSARVSRLYYYLFFVLMNASAGQGQGYDRRASNV